MTTYDEIPKGLCPRCKDYVWSDQARNKNQDVYWHVKCPRRTAGLLEDLEKLNDEFLRRAQRYREMARINHVFGENRQDRQLLHGFKLYIKLREQGVDVPVEEFGYTNKEGQFIWSMSSMHNALERSVDTTVIDLFDIVGAC